MVKVRYTPKGRGSWNGIQPGEETEISERHFEVFSDRFTLLDAEPAPEPEAEEPGPDAVRMSATEAIKAVGEVTDPDDLQPFLDDPRKSVRQRAEGRKRVLDADGS